MGDSGQVVRALQAALDGLCVLPIRVAHALATTGGQIEDDILSPTEVQWMQALARGVTVHRLAESVGYSERELFRLLHDVHERMGVDNRSVTTDLAGGSIFTRCQGVNFRAVLTPPAHCYLGVACERQLVVPGWRPSETVRAFEPALPTSNA